ncbi:unnamed protein product [Angiostrongylus costaricensis]|uniref:RING-type domain-containing protein n=1 Tax=Angiostrongylus costaricensis TaxID=334426 RepID=A0A0R3Q1V3_ANGCS|nr:unnamed protein product [Angiostrongylus costaricensis]
MSNPPLDISAILDDFSKKYPIFLVPVTLFSALLNVVAFLFSILINRRAESIRQVVEVLQCCICIYREKSVLLRPCNHLCLCEICLQAVLNEPPARCPICRSIIDSHINSLTHLTHF